MTISLKISPEMMWQSTRPVSKETLSLSQHYLNQIGVSRDEQVMAVLFDYHSDIANKVVQCEFSRAEKCRLSHFFDLPLRTGIDGAGNLMFRERKL